MTTTTTTESPVRRRSRPNKPSGRPRKASQAASGPGLLHPSINLIPPKYAEKALKRRRVMHLASGSAGAVLALVVLFLAQSGQIALANDNLSSQQSKRDLIQAQENNPRLVAAAKYYGEVDTMTATAVGAMKNEVLYSVLLTKFTKDTPGGMSFTSVSVTTSPAGTSISAPTTCPGPDPFKTYPTIGCITFSGTAPNRGTISALISTLTGDSNSFADPFVQSAGSTSESGQVSFTGTVGIAPALLSGRYANPAYITGGK